MKFAEQLASHITPEWRKQYIQYEEMKSMLYAGVERSPSAEVVEQGVITRYFATFEEEFFLHCEKELTKINTFFSEKIAEATRKSGSLKSELHNLLTGDSDEKRWGRMQEKPGLRLRALKRQHTNARLQTRKIHELRLAFSEFYLSVILLQNYQDLNFTGFRKILKKHDKLINTDAGARWRIAYVEVAPFYLNKEIDKLIQDTERIVTKELEGGDRQKAMKRLRVPPLNDQQSPWVTFKVGLFSGAFTILIGAVAISGIFHGADDWNVPIRLYRGTLLVVMFLFLMGVNVYGWRTSGVNHVLIFEIDPRNHLSEQHLMEMAGILGVLWSLSVLAFLYSDALSIPPYASPLSLIVIMLVFLFNPTKTMRHQARFWLLKYLGRVAGSPFFYVGFADFWLADQLNSLVPVLVDFQYILCFYSTLQDWSSHQRLGPNHCMDGIVSKTVRPIIACLPAWFRFSQCLRRYRDSKEAFPHLVNAGKYSTTFFNVAFSTMYANTRDTYGVNWSNPFFYLWITFAVISSLYTYIWDIKMDWGLFDSSTGDNKFLREEIVYSSPNFYYFAILEDFFLRFGWTLTISLTELGMTDLEILATIFAPLEVFRRFIWNFFRLENEHLNNCGKFRAVRDISVAPLDSSDQALLLLMMDEEDGVTNRKMREGKIVRRKKSETRIFLEENDTADQYI